MKSFVAIGLLISWTLLSSELMALEGKTVILQHSVFPTVDIQKKPDLPNVSSEKADNHSRVLEVIQFSLGFYIDELVDLDQEKVNFRHTPDKQFAHLNEIVKHTLNLYDHPAFESFWGFSARLEKQLIQLNQLNGFTIDHVNKDAPAHNNQVGQYTLRVQMGNFKRAAQTEAGEFIEDDPSLIGSDGQLLLDDKTLSEEDRMLQSIAYASKHDVAMLIDSLFELDEVPLDLISKINMRIETLEQPEPDFVRNQPLDPIAHLIETYEEPDNTRLDLDIPTPTTVNEGPVVPESTDFNSRVLELLEDNNRLMSKYNDRFDYMQMQINELKEAQLTASLEREKHLQDQIDDLYAMMKNIGGASDGNKNTGTGKTLEPVEIIFERNQHNIGLIHQTQLNEVVAGMHRNKNYKLMITGFADRVGDRKYNALLSQKRAQAVYDYLRKGGIPSERMVVNYLGDNNSDAPNPLDRKVEVEWLTNYE